MDICTHADVRIEKFSDNVMCKFIRHRDVWTHAGKRIEITIIIFLKTLLCVKSLDVWTYGHMQRKGLKKLL